VIRIYTDDLFIVRNTCLDTLSQGMQYLPQAEISWHGIRIELQCVLEVLACLLVFALVSEERGQMDAWWKMFLVNYQTFLEQRNRFVSVFLFVTQHGIVEMCAYTWWASLLTDSPFKCIHRFCEFSLLFLHSCVAHKSINIIGFLIQSRLEEFEAVFQVVSSWVSQEDVRQFYIVWHYLALHRARFPHLCYALLFLLVA